MKFKNFLIEVTTTSVLTDEMEEWLNKIKSDCKPFLKVFKTNYLVSGRSLSNELFRTVNIRQDRTPKDTPIWISELADAKFLKLFGIKARSQSLFCYSKSQEYIQDNKFNEYGALNLIFPIGDFNLIWSPEVLDFYGSIKFKIIPEAFKPYYTIRTYLRDFLYYDIKELDFAWIWLLKNNLLTDLIGPLDAKNLSNDDALAFFLHKTSYSENEIKKNLIKLTKNQVIKMVDKSIEYFIKNNYNSKNIESIDDDKEIMLSNTSKKVYMINYGKFTKKQFKLFLNKLREDD